MPFTFIVPAKLWKNGDSAIGRALPQILWAVDPEYTPPPYVSYLKIPKFLSNIFYKLVVVLTFGLLSPPIMVAVLFAMLIEAITLAYFTRRFFMLYLKLKLFPTEKPYVRVKEVIALNEFDEDSVGVQSSVGVRSEAAENSGGNSLSFSHEFDVDAAHSSVNSLVIDDTLDLKHSTETTVLSEVVVSVVALGAGVDCHLPTSENNVERALPSGENTERGQSTEADRAEYTVEESMVPADVDITLTTSHITVEESMVPAAVDRQPHSNTIDSAHVREESTSSRASIVQKYIPKVENTIEAEAADNQVWKYSPVTVVEMILILSLSYLMYVLSSSWFALFWSSLFVLLFSSAVW